MYFTANTAHRYGRVPEKHFFKHRTAALRSVFQSVGLRSALAPPHIKTTASQSKPSDSQPTGDQTTLTLTVRPPATRQH